MSQPAVVAVRAGLIHTLDPERPQAECLVARDGRIEAIGSLAEIQSVAGPSAEWLDLRPATVLPGITDAHVHLVEWALGRSAPDLASANSMADALERIERVCAAVPADAWVEFKGWNPVWRTQAELSDLDAASQGRAVGLVAHDLHSGWLNSETMRRLAIHVDRADPPGGEVERDASGNPTGVVKEHAFDWWYQGRPVPSEAERKAAVLEGQAALHRLGMTGVQSVEAPESFRILEDLHAGGDLRLRVLHHMPQRFIDALIECGIKSGFGNEWLRIGGIKYFTDGALGSCTAWMLEPYVDSDDHGIRRLEPDAFGHDVERAARAGLAATVHAIGDAAVRMTLDTLERVGDEGLAIPHRIEHLQCVDPSDLPRAGRLGVVASMQPSHLLTDIPLAGPRWGPERSRWTLPFRSLLDNGTILAFGSDAPVEEADPREGFYSAIARRDRVGSPAEGWHPEERISGLEVLRAYAEGPARAAGEGDQRGRLSPGHACDFAAWDTDLVAAEPENIRSAQVTTAVVGGEVVFSA